MSQDRQDVLKELWETVVSKKGIHQTLDYKKIRGYTKDTLTFNAGGEYILKRRTNNGKITYYIFKPLSLRQKYVEELVSKLKVLI